MGLVFINIDTASEKQLHVSGVGRADLTAWTITAADGVFGSTSLLNGQPLPASIADGVAIGAIPVPGKDVHSVLTLPPFSVTFAATECNEALSD